MDNQDKPDLNLAVLIDADNVPYKMVKEMMEELAKFGTLTIKRIYGDWTKPHVRGCWQRSGSMIAVPLQCTNMITL